MTTFPQSDSQLQAEAMVTMEGFKRARVLDAEDTRLVTYENSRGAGFYIYEYDDGQWDLGYGYAKLADLSEVRKMMEQLRTVRSFVKPNPTRMVIVEKTAESSEVAP